MMCSGKIVSLQDSPCYEEQNGLEYLKMVPIPLPLPEACRVHCKNLVELLEVKLHKCGPPPKAGLP